MRQHYLLPDELLEDDDPDSREDELRPEDEEDDDLALEELLLPEDLTELPAELRLFEIDGEPAAERLAEDLDSFPE